MPLDSLELSVVIPVYRSAGILPELHERLTRSLRELTSRYEILFVDDASPDSCWTVLQGLRTEDPSVVAVQLAQNSGQQRAVLCGIAQSRGAYVITMDDDLQQRPEEIALLYSEICQGDSDVVIGSYEAKQHSPLRLMGTGAVKWLSKALVDIPRDLDMTSFRIMKREVADRVVRNEHANPVIGFLLYRVTPHISNVRVHHDPRKQGESSYSVRSLAAYFLLMCVGYSDLPVSALALAVVAIGMGLLGLGLYASAVGATLAGLLLVIPSALVAFQARKLERSERPMIPAVAQRLS